MPSRSSSSSRVVPARGVGRNAVAKATRQPVESRWCTTGGPGRACEDCGVEPELPVVSFTDRAALRQWLAENHAHHSGVYVRIPKRGSMHPGLSFQDLLEEGLCFGWSESLRISADARSYLQRFTPRRTRGTTSARNRLLAARLSQQGLMTESGLAALGLNGERIRRNR